MLVMGAPPVEILRQYMAKAQSPTHGREMNVHFNDLEAGYLGQISHLGDMVAVMAGVTPTGQSGRGPRGGVGCAGRGATPPPRSPDGLDRPRPATCPPVRH